MISTMRPQYTGWHPSLVIPQYRYLANKLLFATEFGWSGTNITTDNGPLDLISGKRAGETGDFFSSNNYSVSKFGPVLNCNDVSYGGGFKWTDSQNVAWWVDSRTDIPTSIEVLVYLDTSLAASTTKQFIKMGITDGALGLRLVYDTDHWELQGERITTSSYMRVQSNDTFPTDRWVHVVCTIPAFGFGVPELYTDTKTPTDYQTQLAGSGTSGANTNRQIEISDETSTTFHTGKMTYIRVYQGVLTQDDVNKLYADPFGILRQSPRGFEWVERRPTIRVRARGRG